ncbi:hypothetical protein KY289_030254 [Solanum tuberosum]|nr:hypothetical protein KY284_030037 [Solanum tuberosum]KAH0652576.1 hypothetical protein KY289_030254 [Solanum tuberosum]
MHCPSSGGMFPSNSLSSMCKVDKDVKLPIEDGILPDNLFPFNSSPCRRRSLPKDSGTLPLN